MLKSCGVAGAIVGTASAGAVWRHRRQGEGKVQALVDEGLQAVFCCGETLEEREAVGKKRWCMPN